MKNDSDFPDMPVDDKYRTVRLPEDMIAKVEAYIAAHPEEGYASKAGFIKAAIRALFKELDNRNKT